MKKKTVEILMSVVNGRFAYNNDPDSVRAYYDYSGRGMFGKKTNGVVCSNMPQFIGLVAEVSYSYHSSGRNNDMNFDEFFEDISNIRTDSMGHDIIVY